MRLNASLPKTAKALAVGVILGVVARWLAGDTGATIGQSRACCFSGVSKCGDGGKSADKPDNIPAAEKFAAENKKIPMVRWRLWNWRSSL